MSVYVSLQNHKNTKTSPERLFNLRGYSKLSYIFSSANVMCSFTLILHSAEWVTYRESVFFSTTIYCRSTQPSDEKNNMQTPQIWVWYRVIHVSSDRSHWRKNLTTGTLMAWCSSRTWWWWMLKRNWYSIVCDTLIVLKLNTWYLKHVVIFALDIEMNCGKKTAQHITCKTNHTLMLLGLHSHAICGLFNFIYWLS